MENYGIGNWILPISDTTKKNIKKRWAVKACLFLKRSSKPELVSEVENDLRPLRNYLGKPSSQ